MSLKAKLEAVVYAAEEPVTLAQLAAIFAAEVTPELTEAPAEPATEQVALEGLAPEPAAEDAPAVEGAAPAVEDDSAGAVKAEGTEGDEKKIARQRDRQVRQVLQQVMDTKPEYHDAVRGFVKSLKPPMKLSLQALETLAVIAYKQPVTAPEVSEIRGVDSGGVLGSLVSRKLITTAGRKPVIGRPILYKTTKEFLLRFGLKDVNDLPSMEEFEKMAGELAESEAEGEAQDAGNLVADEAATDSQPSPEAEQDAPEAQQTVQEPTEAEQATQEPAAEQTTHEPAAEQAAEEAPAEPQAEHQV
jgi:segregation and condensation protein B